MTFEVMDTVLPLSNNSQTVQTFSDGGHTGMLRATSIVIALISLMALIAQQSRAKDEGDADAVRQLEQTMGSAMVTGDVGKLSQLYADNFATFGSEGKVITKDILLTDFESFHDKLQWFENGPMDVLVFGNVALAQGSVREKRNHGGKDTSGAFAWIDLLEKRDGKWVVVRTASARLASNDSSEPQIRDPKAVGSIKQFGNELGEAMVARNIKKISQTYADDWATIGSSGKGFTKAGLLEDFKSGNHKLVSFENGPMNVQVFGDVAVVQASVNEKRIQDGKDISGEFVFIDLLKKRSGKWVIVRTLGTKVS